MIGRTKLVVAAAIAAVVSTGAVLGFAMPHHFIGAATWSFVVVAALFGLGGGVRRIARVELAIGEQLVLGTCVWIGASGILLALGIASRTPLLVLAMAGVLAGFVELFERAKRPSTPRDEPTADLIFLVLLSILLALNLLGMLGTRGNPADDQAAYTALVKRVLDCGDLVEPYSFRRLSAYGGQTMLHALAALRGDVITLDLLDRGIFQWIAIVVTLDLARQRRVHFGMRVLIVVVVLSLWDLQLNSGAIWTSYACFLAAYGFATRIELPVRTRLALTLAVLGAICTLRQNYLVPAGLFGALLVFGHLREIARASSWRAAWRTERTVALVAIAAAAVVVVPYMIAALRSSGTALYPIMLGTGSPDSPLRPTGGTLLDEIAFMLRIVFTPEPIRVWWLLVPVMLVVRDRRPLSPWRSYALACAAGFAMLVHSFMLSDAWNLWRYAFGYITPLAIVLAIESAAQLTALVQPGERAAADPAATTPAEEARGFTISAAAAFLVWLALVINLVQTRDDTSRRFNWTLQNIRAAWALGPGTYEPRVRSYASMQASIPEGAHVAVLLDDPWALDYSRNRIFNLDLPGFAAPAPGLPSFTTPEHWRAYFASQGIRYVAFVDPERSSYLYRRAQWLLRMFREDELYQYIAAHMVDAQDALVALARSSQVLFDNDGLLAIDLGTSAGPEPDRGPPLRTRMDAFVRRISEQELASKAWQLAHRSNVIFKKDGMGPSDVVLPLVELPSLGLGARFATVATLPHRWLTARTRVRVLGTGRESLHVRLWVRMPRAYAKLTVTASVDGVPIAHVTPDDNDLVAIDAPAVCHGWCDVYLVFNSTFEWWLGAEDNEVAKLLEFDWAPP